MRVLWRTRQTPEWFEAVGLNASRTGVLFQSGRVVASGGRLVGQRPHPLGALHSSRVGPRCCPQGMPGRVDRTVGVGEGASRGGAERFLGGWADDRGEFLVARRLPRLR